MTADRQGTGTNRNTSKPGRVRKIFFLATVTLTLLFLLVSLLPLYRLVAINWLPDETWLAVRTDRAPGDQVHRLHSMAPGIIAWGMLVGVLAQFHRPSRKSAALLMTLAAPLALTLGDAMSGISIVDSVAGIAPFLILPVTIAVLHPASRDFVRPPRMNVPMTVLTLAAAGPWMLFAFGIGEQARRTGPDGDIEHLGFMASLAVLAILWGLIGAAQRPGWPIAAVAAVWVAAAVGLQSLVFPGVLSGAPAPWATAALAWCVAYGTAGVLRMRRERAG